MVDLLTQSINVILLIFNKLEATVNTSKFEFGKEAPLKQFGLAYDEI